MTSRRGKGQIVHQILFLCKGEGMGKTKIVYALNLNFVNTKEYLDLLVKNGLLEAGNGKAPLYKTTQKGIELLEHFNAIQKMIPELSD